MAHRATIDECVPDQALAPKLFQLGSYSRDLPILTDTRTLRRPKSIAVIGLIEGLFQLVRRIFAAGHILFNELGKPKQGEAGHNHKANHVIHCISPKVATVHMVKPHPSRF
jgi:hypothetical protein